MTLGLDYREVLQEVGVSVVILRDEGEIAGEFIQIKTNAQVTKPFVREFFLEAMLSFDTEIIAGDVIRMDDGRVFLVMNKTPHMFEGEAWKFVAVLYKTNTVGVLLRPTVTTGGHASVVSWAIVKNPCYALITESYYGNRLDEDEQVGMLDLTAMDLYLPHVVGIKIGDQYQVSESEYYRADKIAYYKYENVDVALMGEDTRGLAVETEGEE
jgi:hypothetical protein